MPKLLASMPVAFAVSLFSGTAFAGDATRVASAFEKDNPVDLHATISYEYRFKQAAILREWGRRGGSRLAKDLLYKHVRHTITPNIELGMFRGLAVYVGLPIVVSDDRSYSFDQELGSDCVYPSQIGSGAAGNTQATCVDKTNSSTIRDGIIPVNGFDALGTSSPYQNFTGNGVGLDHIFRGPNRRGIDQLHLGLKYKILDQDKRPSMPNWVLALEGRFGVGTAMKLTRVPSQDPASNHAVGRKIHELGAWTALSRKHRFFEPFFTGFWRYATRANGTEFKKFTTSAQRKSQPQSHAGATLGVEIVPWVLPKKDLKFSINVAGTAEVHYGGRGYSEIWELLADSPALVGTTNPASSRCNANAAVSHATNNPDNPSGYLKAANDAAESGSCVGFSGISDIQDYGTFGINLDASFHLGRFARFRMGAQLQTDTRHFITSASRGDPTLSGPTDTVEPNTKDVNPMRRDVVDNAGRRYAVDDVMDLRAHVEFIMTF